MHLALLPEARDPVAYWTDYYRPYVAADPDALARLFSGSAVHLAARRAVARGRRVLDAGCGLGVLGLMCRDLPSRVVGVDQAGPLLEAARRLAPKADFREGTLARLPVGDATFDLYLAISALECTTVGIEAGLREARRVLAPGGELFAACLRLPLALRPRRRASHVSTLGSIELVRARRPDAGPPGRTVAVYYSGRELVRAARLAGFEDVRLDRCDALGGLAYAPPLPERARARCLEQLGAIGLRRFEGAPRAPFDRVLVEDPDVERLGRVLGPLRGLASSWNVLRGRRPERENRGVGRKTEQRRCEGGDKLFNAGRRDRPG